MVNVKTRKTASFKVSVDSQSTCQNRYAQARRECDRGLHGAGQKMGAESCRTRSVGNGLRMRSHVRTVLSQKKSTF